METNLDQKQLLILGYLRNLLLDANLQPHQIRTHRADDDDLLSPVLKPKTKYEENMQLFNLGVPSLEKMRSASIESYASDLSDHAKPNFSLTSLHHHDEFSYANLIGYR